MRPLLHIRESGTSDYQGIKFTKVENWAFRILASARKSYPNELAAAETVWQLFRNRIAQRIMSLWFYSKIGIAFLIVFVFSVPRGIFVDLKNRKLGLALLRLFWLFFVALPISILLILVLFAFLTLLSFLVFRPF